ncbi:MAG: PKD domain-containing protein [Dysgonamonadaceae bacterium]|jgi:uncharacterized protein (TIGR02145 family)|nr:PKD domain-containing protein [Dysgonamonadaceae bacterium]
MKKRILVVSAALLLSANLLAQVSIGELVEPSPGTILDLNKAVKGGLVLSSVDLDNFHTIPATFPGMTPTPGNMDAVKTGFTGALVYNTGVKSPPAGIYVWNGVNWTPVEDNCLGAENLTLTLTASSNTPAVNTPVTFTVSSNASARCAEGETYVWSAPSATVVSTSGATASIKFPSAGVYKVTVTVHNSYSTDAASTETTVLAGGVITETMKTSGYYLTGKPCYDINKSTTYDTRATTTAPARIATFTNLGVAANRTRTYRFYHEAYTNLVISLLEDNGNLIKSISQPANTNKSTAGYETFTVIFKDNVENLVIGNAYSVKLLASYMDKYNNSKLADMEIFVQDGLCGCPARKSSSEWLTFQCHNLGGRDILTGNELSGADAYIYHGDWYRWGAKTASLANTGTNNAAQGWTAIYAPEESQYPNFQNSSEDDTSQKDADGNNLWKVENNPCPAGWQLPTRAEWSAVVNKNADNTDMGSTYNNLYWHTSSSWSNDPAIFDNIMQIGAYLYLPSTGYRYHSSGALEHRGDYGHYWSRSAEGVYAWYLEFSRFSTGERQMLSSHRTHGFSVRCVASE